MSKSSSIVGATFSAVQDGEAAGGKSLLGFKAKGLAAVGGKMFSISPLNNPRIDIIMVRVVSCPVVSLYFSSLNSYLQVGCRYI